MKKNLFLAGFLATAFLFGCSDDVPENGGLENVKGEVGYVKVAINLPTTSGVPVKGANGNDNFDAGIEAEYKVNDIILAFFKGANEADATCTEAQGLTALDSVSSQGNVTVKYKSNVLTITKPEDGQKVYALAIVNNSGLFSVKEKKLQFAEEAFTGKLSDLNSRPSQIDNLNKIASITTTGGNFLMTNAPITDKAATATNDSRDVTTLVELTVYNTQREAEVNNKPDQIYVERAVAKVTTSVKGTDNTLTITAPGMAYDKATVEFEGWTLNLTNKTYFPVRNVSDWNAWKGYYVDTEVNRFFGEVANPYRVYWAVDPNYVSTGNDALNRFTATNAPAGWNNMGANEYCAENTTTAVEMKQNNLTGILLKTKFKLAGTEDDANLFVLGNASTIYSETNFLAKAKAALPVAADLKIKTGVTEGTTITDKAGVQSLICKIDNTELSDVEAEKILTDCSNSIKFYKGGVMFYYTSVIKHFGDDPTAFTGDVNNPEYTEKDHLGRYGVVRNNWYEINITKVSGPGEPEIPEIPDEPVDKKHSYINAEINILSWAKRTQDVEL